MVNVGASFGPLVAGKLRAISWNYAFLAAAVAIGLMLLITIFFYKEPDRKIEGATLGKKFKDIVIALSDVKFAIFLILLGLFFWLPLWAFFNLLAMYIDRNLDTARLYSNLKSVFGTAFANFLSRTDEEGVRRILGETISHSGYIIMIFQVMVSRIFERFRTIPSFIFGISVTSVGFLFLGYARLSTPAWVFLGIFLFAIGEMISAPRIQEYITWIAPKEKAGLYTGTNFLAIGLGGTLSGLGYTSLYGHFCNMNHPEYVWFTLTAHVILGILLLFVFTKSVGEFKEMEE